MWRFSELRDGIRLRSVIEAIRVRATRLAVIRRGKVIAETPAQTARLGLAGRPETADFLKKSTLTDA